MASDRFSVSGPISEDPGPSGFTPGGNADGVRFTLQPGRVECAHPQPQLACLRGLSKSPTLQRPRRPTPLTSGSFGRLRDLPRVWAGPLSPRFGWVGLERSPSNTCGARKGRRNRVLWTLEPAGSRGIAHVSKLWRAFVGTPALRCHHEAVSAAVAAIVSMLHIDPLSPLKAEEESHGRFGRFSFQIRR